ncbi:MAG: PKD domain-containing protein [Methanomassiliicoccales archaeon]
MVQVEQIRGAAIAAMLFLCVLALAGLPTPVQADVVHHTIALEVSNSARPSLPMAGAKVSFTDAHTGSTQILTTNGTGWVMYYPTGCGSFKIVVNATGFYDHRYIDAARNSEFLRFDDAGNIVLDRVSMMRLPVQLHQVDIGFSGAMPEEGVGLRIAYAGLLDQTAYGGVLTSNASLLLPLGSYLATYGAQGIEPNALAFVVSSAGALVLPLLRSTVLNVSITLGGESAGSTTAYLVSKQKAELGRMVLLPRVQGGAQVTFDAYPGEFYLAVASANGKALVVNVTLPMTTLMVDLQPRVMDRTTSTFQISNADWNLITNVNLKVLQGDSTEPMLQLNRLPDFRMQLDLDPMVGGNANGKVDVQEAFNYSEMLKRIGPDNITTKGLFSLEGSDLLSDANQIEYLVAMPGLIGTDVWSEAEYSISFTAKYRPMGGNVVNGKPSYLILLNPSYNTAYQGWSYRVQLPTNYVLLGASLHKDPVTIMVRDYTTVIIDSALYRPGDHRPALVSLPIVTAKTPSASVGVVLTSSTYRVDQDSYIVRAGLGMSFTAAGSFDPNGNPLTYLWTFGDGGTLTTTSPQVPHTYWIQNTNVSMSLMVRDVSMRTANASLTLKIDGVNPTAVILANGTAPGAVINVDQMQSVEYSASPSYDLIYNETVPQGIIKRYDWSFGDGFYANDSVMARHAYLEPGRFNLTSTLTDASGRVTTTIYAVQVRDTVGPSVIVNITRVADGTAVSGSAVIGDALLFDGSRSTDPGGIVSYSWSFGDGSTAEGATVQHTYSRLGTITGRLTCVDAAGNSGFRPFSLTILPMPGPDLRITEMSFSPTTYMEGSAGTASIDVVNVGSAAAYNINTSFYLVRAEGNTLLAQVHDVTVNGIVVDHLDIGQTGIVSVSLSFAAQGSYTIRANATADGELNPGDNSRSATLQVQESAWKYAGIYFGIIFLVVVLAVLFYMRRGIGVKKKDHRGKKGKKR